MKSLRIMLAIVAFMAFVSPALAIPIVNTADDGIEDRSDGSVYDLYQNSGDLLFTNDGNTTPLTDVQAALQSITGYSGVILTETTVSITTTDTGLSGTWSVIPATNTIDFYAVKAGSYYAFYVVDPAESTGSWSTYDIWAIGGPGTGGHPPNGGGGIEISHFVGYNPATSVPEPGTICLLGGGLLALGFFGRVRAKKNI